MDEAAFNIKLSNSMNMFNKLWKKRETAEENIMTVQTGKEENKLLGKTFETQKFYKHPKILLIDIKDESEKILKSVGFNVEFGTFGTPYKVEQAAGYIPVVVTSELPNYEEQEIIIIDLFPQKTSERTHTKLIVQGDKGFWSKCNQGFIDPRPVVTFSAQSTFEKILNRNGVFVVFADSPFNTEIVWASDDRRFGFQIYERGFELWSFLETLEKSNFVIDNSEGSEVTIKNPDTLLGKFFSKYTDSASFTCTFSPSKLIQYGKIIGYSNRNPESWVVTAVNKYDEPVSGVFTPDKNHNGWIFIFPQIADKANFLLEFLRDILPEYAPELFPYSDNKNWIEKNEYQPPNVRDLNRQIEQIEVEAKQKIEKINEEIQQEKEKIEYQNKLLTTDGDSLVKAVEQTFKVLGFTNVINVDEEYEKQGKTNSNDEDLQIRDKPTSLLVEIKGVTGFPSDNDSRQVTKHIPIRMKEWKEFDVKALSIINHQKAIPALSRDKEPFRSLIVESAKEQYLGLMTTFDLYRLVRSFLKNGWKHENIKDLFIQSGHISIVPVHYEYVGVIEHYWEKVGAVGIRVEENAIKRGDTISYELPIEFEEINVDSLQVENTPTEIAEISMLAGIKTNLTKDILKKGIRVFRTITPKP